MTIRIYLVTFISILTQSCSLMYNSHYEPTMSYLKRQDTYYGKLSVLNYQLSKKTNYYTSKERRKLESLSEDLTQKHLQKKLLLMTAVNNIKDGRYWKVGYFVDEFGDKTKSKFFMQNVNGSFSNVATSNSKLGVDCIITYDNPSLMIDLEEYSRIKAQFNKGYVYLNLKNERNETLKLSKYISRRSNRLSFSFTDYKNKFNQIAEFLIKSSKVKFHIEHDSSHYQFSINTSSIK